MPDTEDDVQALAELREQLRWRDPVRDLPTFDYSLGRTADLVVETVCGYRVAYLYGSPLNCAWYDTALPGGRPNDRSWALAWLPLPPNAIRASIGT